MSDAVDAQARRREVRAIDPGTYQGSYLHDESRDWRETNCAADLWIEALHALGVDPTVALGFTLSADFDGEQWRMFKFDPGDIRRLFGIEYDELNVWRPLPWHLEQQLGLGRMVTVDVDAWYLPDTAGLTYRSDHQKTTVMVQMIDTAERSLGYFHNTGYYELSGEDYDGVLDVDGSTILPPYVEAVRLDGLRTSGPDVAPLALELATEHLSRRPETSPVARMHSRVVQDLGWVADEGMDTFHRYAFGTVRQCGAVAELAASYVDWLATQIPEVAPAADDFRTVATGMKSLEFVLARAARGRTVDLSVTFAALSAAWDSAMDVLDQHCA